MAENLHRLKKKKKTYSWGDLFKMAEQKDVHSLPLVRAPE